MSPQGSLFQSQLLSMATLFFLLSLIASVGAMDTNTLVIPPAVQAQAPAKVPSDYVTQACKATDDLRDLCIKTFSPFVEIVRHSKVKIAEIAINASLTAEIGMDEYMTKILPSVNTSQPPLDPRVAEAMTYCARMHKDTIRQLNGSLSILSSFKNDDKDGDGMSDGDLDDADMNVALAQSNMGECLEQWKNITDVPQKTDVISKTEQVSGFISIARALLMTLEHAVSKKVNIPPPANCEDCVCCPDQKLAPGQCCKCCNAPALPSLEIPKSQLVEDMCDAGDEACKKWVMESN